MFRDDEDIEAPLSRTDALKRAVNHREREERRKLTKVEKATRQRELLKLKLTLRDKVDPNISAEHTKTFGPKTREEELKEQVQGPHSKATTEGVMQEAKREQAAQDQAGYEKQKQADA